MDGASINSELVCLMDLRQEGFLGPAWAHVAEGKRVLSVFPCFPYQESRCLSYKIRLLRSVSSEAQATGKL